MKQLIQDVKSGETCVIEVPPPQVTPGRVLVRNGASLVSAGTERMIVEFANKNIAQKAMARPDLVRKVLDKASREGVLTALDAVRSKLGQPMALGYSCAGTVIGVGEGVTDLHVGDRVACAGFGYASHAEVVSVPRLLVVQVPRGEREVGFDEAAFTTLGAIALQGIRLSEARLGETVAVIGLGLLGQLTVQMLKAAGCRVIGMDLQASRCELARRMGADAVTTTAEELRGVCTQMTSGRGADAVLITADTQSDAPVALAGELARTRGIVVAVGAVGMNIPRKVYYEKELDFRISRSYGPGRYDPEYEEKGHDYPIGYVRWTENRNMEAFLEMVASGTTNVKGLITHRYNIESAMTAYQLIKGELKEPFLGVLLTYPERAASTSRIDLRPQQVHTAAASEVAVGMIGAGNFAMRSLLPAMKKAPGVVLRGICSGSGLTAKLAAEKFGFAYCASAASEVINDPAVNTVVIATRHNLHANQIVDALAAGKHVFCEKPMCLTEEELTAIIEAHSSASRLLMVGYNRRFAPLAVELRKAISASKQPVIMQCRVNGGFIPTDSWIQDPVQGGGRILGEACHFVDLLTFLCGAEPTSVSADAMDNSGVYRDDNVVITIRFTNGSVGTIVYTANGDPSVPKERIEVLGDGTVAVLDDFRRLEITRNGKSRKFSSALRQDKGHQGEWQAFAKAITGGQAPPIPFRELVATSLVTLYALRSMKDGLRYDVNASARINSTAERGAAVTTHADAPTS